MAATLQRARASELARPPLWEGHDGSAEGTSCSYLPGQLGQCRVSVGLRARAGKLAQPFPHAGLVSAGRSSGCPLPAWRVLASLGRAGLAAPCLERRPADCAGDCRRAPRPFLRTELRQVSAHRLPAPYAARGTSLGPAAAWSQPLAASRIRARCSAVAAPVDAVERGMARTPCLGGSA